jgi:hypothetical protein
MTDEDPDATTSTVEGVNTMIYVFGDKAVIINWTSDDVADRITVHPNRVSAIEELETSLQENDPEGFAEAVRLLEGANSVPWTGGGESFVVPSGMTPRFGELLALGLATCDGAESDDPSELFSELTQGRSVFYGHFTDPSEAGFVCFIDHTGTATALIATNWQAGEAVLDAITGIVGGDDWRQIASQLKNLGDETSEPAQKFNPPFSMMLLLGRAVEVHIAREHGGGSGDASGAPSN